MAMKLACTRIFLFIPVLFATLTGSLVADKAAFAEPGFPNAPIRIVVPAAPGTSPDTMARLIGEKMSVSLRQPVIVENKPGASSTIGTAAVVKAKPDGYTLLLTWTALIQSAVQKTKPPYDAMVDLVPVSEIGGSNFVFIGASSLPVQTATEFIVVAQANPEKFSIGSYGNGTSSHILAELLQQSTGIRMVHVPFKSGGPMMTDLLAGHIPVAFVDIPTVSKYVGSDRIKFLATTGDKRADSLKSVPTFAELGVPGLELEGWYGVFAPARTDPVVVDILSNEVAKAIRNPDVAQKLRDFGMTLVGSTPQEFSVKLRRDELKWKTVINAANIQAD